jgi:hypothetical protein
MANEDYSRFDANDELSYYYGSLSKEEVKEILSDASVGTFLIRDSLKDNNNKVLAVKEAPKCINNYKIRHKYNDELKADRYFLQGKEDYLFTSIQKILEFYSTHYLNLSPLVKPAFHHKKVIALFEYLESVSTEEDLYFRKDEVLSVLEFTQGNQWWKAMNKAGKVGMIPVNLIRRLKPIEWPLICSSNDSQNSIGGSLDLDDNQVIGDEPLNGEEEIKCPFNAKVTEDYTPSPYEHSYISLRKGQMVTVLEISSMGKWYGQLLSDGRKGLFPFNRVEMVNTQ